MTPFFNIFKKPLLAHFPNFFGKKNSLENQALSHPTSYEYLASCQNLEKTNDTITRKCLGRRKERWKDGQTVFHRTLVANARGPKSLYQLKFVFAVFILALYGFAKVLGNICLYNLLFFIMLQGTSSTVVQIKLCIPKVIHLCNLLLYQVVVIFYLIVLFL